MAYGSIPLDKRLKDNIRNYKITTLFDVEEITEILKGINKISGVDVLITERHGEKILAVGDWAGFNIDVDANPGIKIRVCERTMAHVYVSYANVSEEDAPATKRALDGIMKTVELLGEKAYKVRELEIYADELDSKLQKETYQAKNGEKNDELTDTLNRTYFENRLKIIDRSQVVPVAAVCININDWKYVNDNYGDDESDRLISTIAGIIRDEAKDDYVIGRVDGDVFNVVVPMPADGEAEDFAARVKSRCESFEDPHIAPSVAIGIAVKENVEMEMADALSDAEYAMFEDKIEVKNAPGYRARLTHGAEA